MPLQALYRVPSMTARGATLGLAVLLLSAMMRTETGRAAEGRDAIQAEAARTGPTRCQSASCQALEGSTRRRLVVFSAASAKPLNLFSGVYAEEKGGRLEFRDEHDLLAWAGARNYVGFWHEPPLDLSGLVRIEIALKGHVSDRSCVDLRLEDSVPGREVGHIYRSDCLKVTEALQTHVLTADDLRRFEHYGEQQGALDWSRIKNIQIQVGARAKGYYPYHGTYRDGEQGRITALDSQASIAWYGHLCYFGFAFDEPLDLTHLEAVRARLQGVGEVDLHLIDSNGVSYYSSGLRLGKRERTHRLVKADFKLFPYAAIGILDWSSIRNLQFQVPTREAARVAIDQIEFALTEGEDYTIGGNAANESLIALKTLHLILQDNRPQPTDQ